MKNTIDAHIEFSFKGEIYSFTSSIDLDRLLAHHDAFPSLHVILAHEHGIDTYSYLYEVMQETEIELGNAQGIAAEFASGESFDHEAFAASWQDLRVLALLQPIALRELGIADLNQHRELKNALTQAYKLGQHA